jgi:hypothetical protein
MTLPVSRTLRMGLLVIGLSLTSGAILACSDDEQTPEEAVCNNIDGLSGNLSSLGEALRDGDRAAAQEAVEDGRNNLVELRDNLEQTEIRATASQTASEVNAQLDSISQTLQQGGQGGAGIVQLLQEVGPQLTAIITSLQTLDNELSSLQCN